MLRSIRKFDDPILKEVCKSADGGDFAKNVVKDLRDTLRSRLDAVGLAAPQIGANLRIIAIKPTRLSGVTILVNPEIVSHSEETDTAEEGCLSYPGVRTPIERFNSIRVAFDDADGRFSREYEGWPARIIQHEIDHLDGICRVGDAWRAELAHA